MNRMMSLAKIMFVGLAIYISIGTVRNILIIIGAFGANLDLATALGMLWSLCVSAVFLAAVYYFLVIKRNIWARKLIAKDITTDQPLDFDLTLTMAFRLVSVGIGIYCLFACTRMFSNNIMKLVSYKEQEGQTFSGAFRADFIQPAICLILTIYLLCGAPHFVRWQVKRTLEFCANSRGELKDD